MKQTILAMLVLVLMLIVAGVAGAQTYGVDVFVDDEQVSFPDQSPFVDDNNRTQVPIRFIAEYMGARVEWHEQTKTVGIFKDDKRIYLEVGVPLASVSGELKIFDTSPVIVNSRTMVPLRFISETLGATVEWDGDTRTVYIFSEGYGDSTLPQARVELTEDDIHRLRNYSIDPKRMYGDYLSFDDFYKTDAYVVNFAVNETLRILNNNDCFYEGEFYENAEVKFFTDPKTVYRTFQGHRAVRGVLQIKYNGPNDEGLEPGKLYERDMEYRGIYTALDHQTIGWWIAFRIPLSDYAQVKE